MKGYVPIDIPTKRYIKAYLIKKMGERPIMNNETTIGSKLHDVLQYKANDRKNSYRKPRNLVYIRIYIPRYVFFRRGCHLNETNIRNFNIFCENEVKDRFHWMMDLLIEIFPSFESNLPLIRSQLGIDDEDWSYDSMKKEYYRYRIRMGKPLLYNVNREKGDYSQRSVPVAANW